ncbi:hypothetical protein ACFL6I_01015 [candidate division KSB1 bacterium]
MVDWRMAGTKRFESTLYALLYIFINSLFVLKYTARITGYAPFAALLYASGAAVLLILCAHYYRDRMNTELRYGSYIAVIVFLAALLLVLMKQVDPAGIQVGRYPALTEWIGDMLDGRYPYTSDLRPSGFPFLFVLALPFYALGDVGLLQICSFLLFGLLVFTRYPRHPGQRYKTIVLLTASPVFLYEVVVRSELFSNMAFVLLYLVLCERYLRSVNRPPLLVLGLAGGLMMSTRGIVFIIFLIYFGFCFKSAVRDGLMFAGSLAAGFAITVLPFLIWDARHFLTQGPFSVQAAYAAPWLLILVTAGSAAAVLFVKTVHGVYRSILVCLFGAVFVSLCVSVLREGFNASVMQSGFDISYFAFSLPFVLLLFDFRQASPGAMTTFFEYLKEKKTGKIEL